jgi:hypothetical protein
MKTSVMMRCPKCSETSELDNLHLLDRSFKLEWVGLTRDEQSFVYQTLHNSTSRIDSFWVDFANAIEAKLKEKNT